MKPVAARPRYNPSKAINVVDTPNTSRAGDDVVGAQRHDETEHRPRPIHLLRRLGPPRLDDEVQTVDTEPDRPHELARLADRLTRVVPQQDAQQWRQPIAQPEHHGDLHRTAPAELQPAERDRRPEVVQTEGKSEDDEAAEHRRSRKREVAAGFTVTEPRDFQYGESRC